MRVRKVRTLLLSIMKYGHAYEHYIYQGNAGTDWQDEVFGSNPVAKYVDLSVNGGTDKAKYKISLSIRISQV